ncbi:glycosyltransferase family 2 protein [Enterococcus eurekensis]|uniref:Glycosyltransferase family 2 protein n=1 Tax=Enterococcus eurekensis TaxID=1159753 RepID=A0ABV9M4M6_9ENTE
MKILLIIPAYNEEESILSTISSIEKIRETFPHQLDYLVINDGSIDSTEDILKQNKINYVTLLINSGIGVAVQTGYKFALENEYDIAVQFDGDGQHDINSLENLISSLITKKADLAVGSRFLEEKKSEFQTTLMRRVGINILSFFIKAVSGKRIRDTTSGYRAGNKKVIKEFAKRYPTKYPEPESIVYLLKKGYTIKECPVNMFERQGGTSSITPFKSVRYMIDVCSAILILLLLKEED